MRRPSRFYSPTVLISLPNELLSIILSSCSNRVLLALAQTCTRLHSLALQIFFKRNKIREPEKGFLSGYNSPRGTLDAFRMALAVNGMTLNAVYWIFNPMWQEDGEEEEEGSNLLSPSTTKLHPGMKRGKFHLLEPAFDEMDNLRRIFARSSNIKVVHFDFSVLGFCGADPISLATIKSVERCVYATLWRRKFSGLLDEALHGGCEELRVSGGSGSEVKDFFKEVSEDASGTMQPHQVGPLARSRPSKFNPRKTVNQPPAPRKNPKRQRSPNTFDITNPTPGKPLKIKRLQLHSDLFLRHPLLAWTTSLLCPASLPSSSVSSSFPCNSKLSKSIPSHTFSASPTLTHLSIIPIGTDIPTCLLTTLNLPNLVDVEIKINNMFSVTAHAKFEDIATFLGRHSERLETVSLLGVGLPPLEAPATSTRVTHFFDTQKPIFPRLKSVITHPAYIVWLLSLATGVSTTFFTSTNDRRTTRSKTSASNASSSASYTSHESLQDLESIGIASERECHPLPPFDYGLFDQALKAVGWSCRWWNDLGSSLNGSGGRRGTVGGSKEKQGAENTPRKPRTINLALQFISEPGVAEWFASHLSTIPALPSTSILTQLTNVSTLSISGCWVVQFQQETVEILPEWLASFGKPKSGKGASRNLHKVEFIEMRDALYSLGTEDFLLCVARRCVPGGLRWLVVGETIISRKTFDLVKIREGSGISGSDSTT